LIAWVQLYIGTAWISIVSSDDWNGASTLHDNIACIALLFLSFLIWHKDGRQLGLYEKGEQLLSLTKLVPVKP